MNENIGNNGGLSLMARKIVIGVLAAALVALGVVAYIKTKSKMAQDRELTHDDVPASDKVPETANELPLAENETDSPAAPAESAPAVSKTVRAGTGHFEISVPYEGNEARDKASSLDDISNSEREKRIRAVFAEKGSATAKYVKIKSLSCRDTICTMDAEATPGTDGESFQNSIVDAVRNNPWIGNKIDVTTPSNDSRRGRFVFFHELAK
jgi:hypothetical protein